MRSTAEVSRAAVLEIATPEGVTFSQPLAGPVTRGLAYFVDLLVLYAAFNGLLNLLRVFAAVAPDVSTAAFVGLQFVALEGYRTISELLWRGQTVGKKALGIRVMDERGLKLQPSQVVVRNLVRLVDFLPGFYAVGGVACLLSRRCQRLGDLAAGTVVVRTVKIRPPDVEALLGGKYNSFRQYPHLEARLRQKVGPDEVQVALSALVRRDQMDPQAAIRVFEQIAARFKAEVKFPDEVVLGLSDEQYVRNVIDSLFRRKQA